MDWSLPLETGAQMRAILAVLGAPLPQTSYKGTFY